MLVLFTIDRSYREYGMHFLVISDGHSFGVSPISGWYTLVFVVLVAVDRDCRASFLLHL